MLNRMPNQLQAAENLTVVVYGMSVPVEGRTTIWSPSSPRILLHTTYLGLCMFLATTMSPAD